MKWLSYHFTLALVSTLLVLGLGCGNDTDRAGDAQLEGAEVDDLDLSIKIALQNVSGEQRLAIKANFVMPRDRILLRMPESYLRKENLYQRIEQLRVNQPGKLYAHRDSSSLRVLEFPKGERVTLEYFYRPDDPLSYGAGKETFSAPIIRPEYFQFVGSMVFVYPVALVNVPQFKVRFEWETPAGFRIFNSFGAEKNAQEITTDFDKIRDAFFVAGKNIRAYKMQVRSQPVWITFEGSWKKITDQDFVDVVTRLLATQREAFNDDNYPYFLVNFLAEDIDCGENVKFAGTAHPNSFRAIFPGGRKCAFIPEMRQLISHELMHMWIGKKIRVGEERGHIDGKWFTEGFTDYFGRMLAVRAGVITEDEFFSSLNRQLEKYYTSSERNTTLRELVDRMYRRGVSTRTLEELPYQQGEIMAWQLNKHIKTESSFSKNLDDVLKDMLAEAENAGGYKKLTVKELEQFFDSYSPQRFREEYSKILRGGLFMPPNLAQCRQPQQSYVTRFRRVPERVSTPIIHYGPLQTNCVRWLN